MKINKRNRLVYKNISELCIGDEVISPRTYDEKYTLDKYIKSKIIYINELGVQDVYKLTLSDGREFRTYKDHLTPVCFRQKNNKPVWDCISTKWMMNNSQYHFAILDHPENLEWDDVESLMLEHENEPDDNITPYIKDGVFIQKIEKENYQEKCRCITLSNPEGLYYTDNKILTHNSTLAVLVQLYISVHYAMMWHPYSFFGLAPSSIFTQCLGGWNQKKASELLVEPFVNILEASPYFKKVRTHTDLVEASGDEISNCIHWTTSSPTSILSMQNGVNIKIICGAGSILGQNIISAAISEMTMFEENGWSQEKIFTFFTKLRKRIDSRMKSNYYGRCLIDNQPNALSSPIDDWICNSAPKNSSNFIVSGSRWKFYPKEFPEAWSESRTDWHEPLCLKQDFINAFPIFKGGDGTPAKVVETKEELATFPVVDIVWAPMKQITSSGIVNFKESALESPINFLRDWAGIPSNTADRILYNSKWIEDIFDNNLKNVYSTMIAKAEDEPEHLIWNQIKDEYFHTILGKYYFYYEPNIPRVASIDLAISGDTAAISISHVERDKERLDTQGQPLKVYVTDLIVPIIPKGGMINLDAFKFFIIDLIKLGNMNIRHVSFDSFQSRAMMQSLERMGIKVDYVSVDKNNAPYLSLIDYIIHRRYFCGKSIMLKNNLLSLQMTKRKQTGTAKIDHMNGDNVYSDEFCMPGSSYTEQSWTMSKVGSFAKDCGDVTAGNMYLLDTYENEYIPYHVWDPLKEKERTYEGELSKQKDLLSSMGLK